jgi:hypothetical protein
MTELISTDAGVSGAQRRMLEILVDMMIPANGEFPSARAPDIFARTLAGLQENVSIVGEGLVALDALAEEKYSASFQTLTAADRDELIAGFKPAHVAFVQILQARVISSYYQDDRVLRALGLPVRAPHPGGYEVPDTDWSLLDPVRNRKPFYKEPTR